MRLSEISVISDKQFQPVCLIRWSKLSFLMQTLDDQIFQGIEDKRIEAVLAQKIHAVTSKYDSQLSAMLARRVNLAQFFDDTTRAKLLSLNAENLIFNIGIGYPF